MPSPRRLIEVDFPIRAISTAARREKALRHGHLSTLHPWWARKPLGVSRAEICAASWPDPADPDCPASFREAIRRILPRQDPPLSSDVRMQERQDLLDLVAALAHWESVTDPDLLHKACALTEAAGKALFPDETRRMRLGDPFGGGGTIPLEGLRLGMDVWTSDLNPVAALLCRVVTEILPTHGEELAMAVRQWGRWVGERAQTELAHLFPSAGAETPLAYLWFRTIRCEGPGCGAEIPLTTKLELSLRRTRPASLAIRVAASRIELGITEAMPSGRPTVARGVATCPACGATTSARAVRKQLRAQRGGAAQARLGVVVTVSSGTGRHYRLPTAADHAAVLQALREAEPLPHHTVGVLPALPDEPLPPDGTLGFNIRPYGMHTWGDLFTPRQQRVLRTLCHYLHAAIAEIEREKGASFARAVGTCLAFAVDRQADYNSSLCRWVPRGEYMGDTFARQAISMVWDFAEVNPFSGGTGSWQGAVEWVAQVCASCAGVRSGQGETTCVSATDLPQASGSTHLIVTDPPYYDAVPYADLSEFFYVWLRRTVGHLHPDLFSASAVPRDNECVVNPGAGKDHAHFRATMRRCLEEARRVLDPDGVCVVIFAHQSTAGWEAQVGAMIDAGWVISGTWPVDTEMPSRLRARHSAVLASSVHMVCRPRTQCAVGEWRDLLDALPERVASHLLRLQADGVVGADALFACLGPALELFSRYDHVERVSGERVELSTYLEHVWGVIAEQALRVLLPSLDADAFGPDGRLTALWLWTCRTEFAGSDLVLPYDAVRKLAQGLGARLEPMARPGGIIEIQGGAARLLPVAARMLPSGPPSSRLERLHRTMRHFAQGDVTSLRGLLQEADDGFWSLAQALVALYPEGSNERRWVQGVLLQRNRPVQPAQ